jgi:hypothetical protein
MPRRAQTVMVALVAFLSASPALATAAHASSPECGSRHGRLVAADREAEIYIAQEPVFERHTHNVVNSEPAYRGCAYGSRRSFRLGIAETESDSSTRASGTDRLVLAGADVAYETYEGVHPGIGPSASYIYVVVRNLRTGRVVHEVPSGIPLEAEPYHVGVGGVAAIVLKSNGWVAWIARDHERSESAEQAAGRELSYYDLYALDSTGQRLVAFGTEIDPSSLALAGSTFYWTQGGKSFSALLQ